MNNMRKFRIIIGFQLVVVIYSLKIFGQPVFKDFSQANDYWSKRGIIEVVYAYMNDYIITVTDSSLPKEKIKDCTNENIGLKAYEKQFVKPLENLGIEELSSKFNEVSSFLKSNNWKGAEKNVFQPLQNNLSLKKTLNNDFFSTLKSSGIEKSTDIPGYSNKMDNWNNTVERIISSYNEDIRKLKNDSGNKPTNAPGIAGIAIDIGDANPPDPEKQNWFLIASFILLSFFVGAFLCFYIIRSKIYQIMDEDLDKYKNIIQESGAFTFLSMVKLLKKRKNEYKKKVEEFEIKYPDTQKTPKSEDNIVISASNENDSNVKNIEETNNTVEWNITNDSNNQKGLFFTIPDGEGKFEVSDGKSQNDGNCFYRIENKPNSNQAILSYISNEKDKRAIENIENYLLPVCDIENFSDRRNASKVHMKVSGIVKLNNGIWVIDPNHKVKIKLV
jgi:hypothetical protein